MKTIKIFYIILFSALLASCGGSIGLKRLLEKSSPYQQYLTSLREVALTNTAMGKDWVLAGEASLNSASSVNLPYQEIVYFNPEKPQAISLRYPVQEGQVISIDLDATNRTTKIFLDIFKLSEGRYEPLAGSDTTGIIEYEVKHDETHILRLQPELLRGGQVDIKVEVKPSINFPVAGKNSKAVGSFFGAPRDGGARPHQGIDIFAPRGTPVIAATKGRVSRVTLNRLGGKVVFLSGADKGFSMYYAHLDSQLVSTGQRVKVGDTLGLVGNTGNAITTPPHLHFGIYKFTSGAVDPYPFVKNDFLPLETIVADTAQFNGLNTINSVKANIRIAPDVNAEILTTLPQNSMIEVLGGTGKWYRIELPDGTLGFVYHTLIQKMEAPIKKVPVRKGSDFFNRFSDSGLYAMRFSDLDSVKVWATFDSLQYVETREKGFLWMKNS